MFDFERVACVSLARRPNRWKRFLDSLPAQWPFGTVERVAAIDGDNCPQPSWWQAGKYAWGCYNSHLNILEQCLNQKIDSCLFLEDDAICCDGFGEKIAAFKDELPDDWEMIYLGGQHLHADCNPPVRESENVFIPYNVNRTHAFAIRGKSMMKWIYRHLNQFCDWQPGHHIDHHLGRAHQLRERPIYCPAQWLIGQNEGKSDISRNQNARNFFPPADSYGNVKGSFVAVMGVHCSTSARVALALNCLGVFMGNQLVDDDPVRHSSGEAVGLAEICESAMPFPGTKLTHWEGNLKGMASNWVRNRMWQANQRNQIAGGKHPLFCTLGPTLESGFAGQLKVIHVKSPLQLAIASLIRQEPKHTTSAIRSRQDFLWRSKEDFIQRTNVPVLNVCPNKISSNPKRQIDRIVRFLELNPTANQFDAAINLVQGRTMSFEA